MQTYKRVVNILLVNAIYLLQKYIKYSNVSNSYDKK